MIKIMLLILQFNYNFTIGYIPVDDFKICDISNYENLYFIEFGHEILLNKLFFADYGLRFNFTQKDLIERFYPYQIDLNMNCGMEYKFIEIGFVFYCNYSMGIYPSLNYSKIKNELYIKLSNKNKRFILLDY